MVVSCVAVDLSQLDQEVSVAVASAWSSNTLSTRNSQWSRFIKFCGANELTPIPATTHTVARFLVWQARTSKYVTVNNYLSALVSLQKFYGHEMDYRGSFLIQLVLKGLKSQLGDTAAPMNPLTIAQLQDMYAIMDKSCELNYVLWSALIFAFRTLLRKSNVVPDSNVAMQHIVRRKDITFHSWGMLVSVRSSKTLRCHEEVLQIPVTKTVNPVFCAVSALQHHFEIYPADSDSPLFLKPETSGFVPVLYKDLHTFVKDLVKNIGLDPENYGSHSLRKSGAMYLHSINVPLEDIMCIGHWKSMAVLAYLATPPDRKREIQDYVSTALSSL